MRDCLVTSPAVVTTVTITTIATTTMVTPTTTAATTTTVPRAIVTTTSGQQNTVRESSPKPATSEFSPKPAKTELASKSPVCKLKVGNNCPENVENYTQNEEGGHLSNDSGVLEPMEDAQDSACLGCEDAKVPLIEKPKETASLKETLEESEAPLSATSKDGALLTEAAEQNEAPLSETYEGLSESHRATQLNVTRSNGGSPTQTTMELSAARYGGQKERGIRDSDNEVETSVNKEGNSSKGGFFSLVSDAVNVVTGGEGETSQVNTTSPIRLLETVDSQTALLETMETGEGDDIPMSKCRPLDVSRDLCESVDVGTPHESLGGVTLEESPDTPISVEAETHGASLDQSVERNDKESLKTNATDVPNSLRNKVNRGATCKWRVQLKSYSPAAPKTKEMKPKSLSRISNTKTSDSKKYLCGTPAVSAVKTKKKDKGKKSGKKSVRWSDLTLPDSVQQYFNRSCTEIIPGAQSQDKVHFKSDPSPNSKVKPTCRKVQEKERKIASKMKNKGPRKVKVAKDRDNNCKEGKVPSVSAEEFIPAEAQHSNTPNNQNRAENNVSPGKRQMATPHGTNREKKRRKMATLGSSKPETERCSQRKDGRAKSTDDEQIKSTSTAVKSTGPPGSKEVS